MRNRKPGRRISWAAMFFISAILGVNGCGELGNNTAPNDTPVANAGRDQGSIRPGDLITLNGSASSDPDGQPLTYSWSFTSKPAGSTAALTNPTSSMPTFTLDLVGEYVVRLIVNDGMASSAPDSVIISTGNVAPVANAGPDQGDIAPGTVVTLNGSASSDANGDPLTYRWSLIGKPAGSTAALDDPTSPRPTFTIDRAGTYTAQLIVSDGTLTDTDTVNISTVNVAPVANAGPDQANKTLGSLVTLNGSASSDANGDPLTYRWSLIGKPAGSTAALDDPTSPRPTFTIDRAGTYTAQLIVSDGTLTDTDTVNISTVNVAPVANAGPDQANKTLGSLVTLNGSASSDANGDPLTYRWSLIGKPAGSTAALDDPTSPRPTFTIDRAGTYTAQLIVSDGTLTDTDTVNISTVNVAPVANAGPDQANKTLGSLVTLNGSASSDANGDPLTYSWSLTSKPRGSTAALDDPTSSMPTFTVDRAGTYRARLIVSDGTLTDTDTVRISATRRSTDDDDDD